MKANILPGLAIAVLTATAFSAAPPDPGFVAHEWGTFTSVQGADGIQAAWNPFVAPELPTFVYDKNNPRGKKGLPAIFLGKPFMFCRQRMETPVIYFYSHQTRTVDVSVKFPHGEVTEWFPFQSAPVVPFQVAGDKPALHWEKLQLLVEPDTKGVSLPEEKSGSHYYAARDTDSTVVQTINPDGARETEKFLFYRGVGSDISPLTVKVDASDSHHVTLINSGAQEMRNLFLFEVRAAGGGWLKVDRLAPGESRQLSLPTGANAAPIADLAAPLRQALVSEGLYPREAAAMVKTWESSWFSERGMRVLYTLPRQWTDQVIPLQITPAPRELTRVMVARAEIITPEMEKALAERINPYVTKEKDRAASIAEIQALKIGRFLEPTWMRVMSSRPSSSTDDEYRTRSWELIQSVIALNKP